MTQADNVHSTPPYKLVRRYSLEQPADAAGALYVMTPVASEDILGAMGLQPIKV